jgi:hypothetical protein
MMEQAARSSLPCDGPPGYGAERFLAQSETHAFHLEKALILLQQRILRFRKDALEGQLVKILECSHHGQLPDELGDEAVFEQILWRDLAEDFPVPRSSGAITFAPKPMELDRQRAEMIFSGQ